MAPEAYLVEACPYEPGSSAKLAVLQARLAKGLPLFVAGEPRIDGVEPEELPVQGDGYWVIQPGSGPARVMLDALTG